ncbi:MAG: hypothetical protein JSR87_12195 [Proteobacteria bacterium]|nr:hypothetical protein [Pseudomonadota bacterium]MBS0574131.1 hypothetical protein [Pseudomonadota bacterium]
MKPRFAFDLTNETITLLERTGEGWARIGATALDAPDLDGRMAGLRHEMEARAPEGFCSKLILPNSQILYLEIEVSAPDRQGRRAQIAEALRGRTPYDVADLVFDWSQGGPSAKVAVVARETLDEAEAFAEAHGLRPVAFVAVPEAARFGGEPFFGLAARSADYLSPGERLDRDQDPVRVVAAAPVPADPLPADLPPSDLPPPEADPEPADAARDAAPPAPEPDDHQASLAEPAAEGPVADADGPDGAPFEGARPEGAPVEMPPAALAEADPDPQIAAADEPAEPAAEDRLPEAGAGAEADIEAPFIAIDDLAEADDPALPALAGDEAEEAQAAQTAAILRRIEQAVAHARITEAQGGTLAGAAVAELAPSARDGFQSRRPSGPGGAEGSRLAAVAPRLGGLGHPPSGKGPRPETQRGERPAGGEGPQGPDETAAASGRLPAALSRAVAGAQLSLAGAMPAGAAPVRAAPARAPARVIAATRTGAGLIAGNRGRAAMVVLAGAAAGFLLLAVALWSLFVGEGTPPSQPPPAAESGDAGASQTATSAPSAATGQANLAPTEAPVPPAATAPQPEPAAPGTTAPATAAAPTVTAPSDVQAGAPAAIAPPQPDAATLPAVTAALSPDGGQPPTSPIPETGLRGAGGTGDASLPAQPLPLPLGAMPTLGPDGLFLPTPGGTLTPDGFTLYAGKPPVLPPARPAGLAEAAAQAAQAADPLFAVKPRARPASLAVPAAPLPADSGALTPPTPDATAVAEPPPAADPRLARPRPKARPAAVLKAAEAARQTAEQVAEAAASAARAEAEAAQSGATAQAVARSEVPTRRPKAVLASAAKAAAAAPALPDMNSADAVAAALSEAAQPAPEAAAPAPADTATQQVEEPEPQPGLPSLPTTKLVAKKSTLANALDLGSVSLIGVYGSPSHRRALVRMPNGRFIKVQIGDALDGGQVAAIGDNELTYVKGGRTLVLKMVKGG